ncbi:MAG: hypothetical protein K1X64_07305 [Myxococcaceae bacterium]|nr:hypothetical protein [Myxococcaceae bacterium]
MRILFGLGVLLAVTACNNASNSVGQRRHDALCDATDANKAFGAAVCVCEDMELVGAGLVAHSSSGATANVGINGVGHVVGHHDVSGSLVAMGGLTGTGRVDVGENLATTKDIEGVGAVSVQGNLMVGGTLTNVGRLDVKGMLGTPSDSMLVGSSSIGSRGAYSAPAEPCGCAQPAVDVAAAIASAKGTAKPLGDMHTVGASETTLSSGSYWVQDMSGVGKTTFIIDGAVAIYVQDTLREVGSQTFTVNPGATLDLYVGNVESVGALHFGENADPGSVRLFIASEGTASVAVGSQKLNASIYAPKAELSLVGSTDISGAIFARRLTGVGRLNVDYASPAQAADEHCMPTDETGGNSGNPPTGSEPSADAGSPGIN